MPKLELLKNLGVMIPESKKAIFKGNCASAGLDMREVLEAFVDRFNENPKILEGLKKMKHRSVKIINMGSVDGIDPIGLPEETRIQMFRDLIPAEKESAMNSILRLADILDTPDEVFIARRKALQAARS